MSFEYLPRQWWCIAYILNHNCRLVVTERGPIAGYRMVDDTVVYTIDGVGEVELDGDSVRILCYNGNIYEHLPRKSIPRVV